MLDRREHPEQARVVKESVESAITLEQRGGERVVVVGDGLLEIERGDRRFLST
jgi:hypothetical protein